MIWAFSILLFRIEPTDVNVAAIALPAIHIEGIAIRGNPQYGIIVTCIYLFGYGDGSGPAFSRQPAAVNIFKKLIIIRIPLIMFFIRSPGSEIQG